MTIEDSIFMEATLSDMNASYFSFMLLLGHCLELPDEENLKTVSDFPLGFPPSLRIVL